MGRTTEGLEPDELRKELLQARNAVGGTLGRSIDISDGRGQRRGAGPNGQTPPQGRTGG